MKKIRIVSREYDSLTNLDKAFNDWFKNNPSLVVLHMSRTECNGLYGISIIITDNNDDENKI